MYLTMDEVKEKYDGQWVFMINCKEGEYHETIGGEVVLHSERRDKVIREMAKYKHEKSRTFITYVGGLPEGVSVLL